ncbi:hypothetical protein DB30_05540 [Enhygromyxa salina]|uniref:Uncharacterized protein n=1 Tax=Enhygromyxa salina TaxID=215803 RepID=A0A0C2D645_9BACT|nr:hypothetical protein [Enhygromyxa salina]KIG15517.1 hypothetical protein DB30_05540 [Enhygromyxa salina]
MLDHAAQLRANGYTLLDSLIPADATQRYAAALRAQWRRLGEPALVSQADVVLEPGVHVSPVGMTCAGILERIPELAQVLVEPQLLALFTELLGPDFELEFGAGVVSDETRGFFFWHHHVGGIDAEDLRGAGYPSFERIERLGFTLYASPLDDAHGVMQVWPRGVQTSTAPAHPPGREPWPGAAQVRAPIGSVVVFEQGTWHAVTPMTHAGQRCFFGFFVRRAGLPPTKRRDPGTEAALANNATLRAAYGGLRAHGGAP